jgi:hypothetical protein
MDGRPIEAVSEWFIRSLIDRPGKKKDCPCCNRVCAVYKRSINADQARALIHFYKEFGQEWGDFQIVRRQFQGLDAREEGKLGFWNLVEFKKVGTRKNGRPGKITYTRITDLGLAAWLNRETKIPQYALIYYGEVLGYKGEDVSIDDCLAKKDYELEDLLLYSGSS